MQIRNLEYPKTLKQTRVFFGMVNFLSSIARLDSIVKANKQNYKSNLMTEKYSLLPSQSYPLTPAQTALQLLSEKHPDFEIQPVNTIQPPEIEYTLSIYHCQLSESIYHDSQT